jgi:hypothetical protein
MKDFKEAARNHVIKTATSNKPDEYELKLPIGIMKEHCREDFLAGANHGYSEAMKEQREFVSDIREFLKVHHFNTAGQLSKYMDTKSRIETYLSSFTEQSNKEDNGER